MSLPSLYQAPAETAEWQHTFHPTFPHSAAQQKATFTKVHPQVFWGDPHTFPSTTQLRIVFQNCNTLSKVHFTRFSYLNRIKLLEPHIFGLAENNLNWSHFPTKTLVYSSLKARWPQLRVATSFGGSIPKLSFHTGRRVPPANIKTHQRPGPGIILGPMGRWCSQTLQGASNHHITVITAYRVCQTARSGLFAAY
jgi:hypothetical protein